MDSLQLLTLGHSLSSSVIQVTSLYTVERDINKALPVSLYTVEFDNLYTVEFDEAQPTVALETLPQPGELPDHSHGVCKSDGRSKISVQILASSN